MVDVMAPGTGDTSRNYHPAQVTHDSKEHAENSNQASEAPLLSMSPATIQIPTDTPTESGFLAVYVDPVQVQSHANTQDNNED